MNDARDLGRASAEEWFKGLEMEGKERLDDVVRWEQWEARGGLKKVNQPPHIKPAMMTGSATVGTKPDGKKIGVNATRSTSQRGLGLPVKPNVDSDGSLMRSLVPSMSVPTTLRCKLQIGW